MLNSRLAILLFTLLLSTMTFAQDKTAQNTDEDFFAAARRGDIAAVKTFLDKGTDVNTKTRYGATALFYACDRGNLELIKLLLERGADPNVKDTFYGATPMTWAVDKGNVGAVKLLIEKGSKEKDAALALAVDKSSPELVKTVLDKGGASSGAMTKAITRANADNKTEIAEALKKAGAVPFQTIGDEVLKTYAGMYKHEQVGELTFTVKDGKFVGQIKGQGPFTVGAISKTTFTIIEFDGATFEFNLENDKATGVTLKQGGRTFQFKKIE
ncbi:MAG: ankyrin repeat domain-containing protein [Acidobacteriota bacterium]